MQFAGDGGARGAMDCGRADMVGGWTMSPATSRPQVQAMLDVQTAQSLAVRGATIQEHLDRLVQLSDKSPTNPFYSPAGCSSRRQIV
jgi:hypothetical protein